MNRSIRVTTSIFLTASLFLAIDPVIAGQGEEWIADLKKNEMLDSKDKVRTFAKRNIHDLWVTRDYLTLGYIGPDFQRLRIQVTSARKTGPLEYSIAGRSRASADACTLNGVLTLKEAFDFKRPFDDCESGKLVDHGILIGEYRITERGCRYPGTFEGIFSTRIYHEKGAVRYDDTGGCSDGDENNSFVGTWKSAKTGQVLVANWGDKRIPFSGDLDMGAAEFYPAEAYWDKGWESYHLLQVSNPDSAWIPLRKENRP